MDSSIKMPVTSISCLLELDENNMESFVETSKEIAKALFNVVIEGEDIPPADFVCASFQESGNNIPGFAKAKLSLQLYPKNK